MATGRPVVSTRLGAEGLEVTDGIDILLGDSPRTIADHLVALAEHAELRARIASAGRRLVESTYDWETCFRGLDLLYEAVTATVDRRRRPVEELAS
jgi:glycosyltransferase involved in cell wall biosynthesis